MEYNRYNQNYHFRRDHQRNPYDRDPPQRGRQPNRGPRRPYQRQHYNTYNGPRHRQNTWPDSERTFDSGGREILRNQGTPSNSYYRREERRSHNEMHGEAPVEPHATPLEKKARSFLQTVLGQRGIRSRLIFLETVENALQTLQGTVDYCQMQMVIEQNTTGEFVLKIDKETIAKGTFLNKQAAKNALAEQAMEILRQDCFYIVKKRVYEEVSTKTNEPKEEAQPQLSLEGSKAHQMMLKMGWGGKGLGINEQGAEKTVAETIDQNVSREGLGTDDVFKKIHKLLEDYSKSDKMSLLRFDPDFTSDERAHIHKIANKFALKSKSEGKGEQRRITVTKKLHRGDLVYNLLTCGLENTLYKLIIPTQFAGLWHDDEQEDDDDDNNYHPHFSS